LKEIYRKLCNEEPSIPLFSQAWWLDAVAGENWNVCLVEKGGQVLASMPYVLSTRFGMKKLSKPALTQTLGPWIRHSSAKYAKQLSRDKELMGALIDQLPPYQSFMQTWHFSYRNWLPFYWKGFQQTTRYTYRIESLSCHDTIWSGFQDNIRREIRKAEGREQLRIRTDRSVEDFYNLNKMVFERQGEAVPYSLDFILKLDSAAEARQSRKIIIAEDPAGRQHAGVYLVWDKDTCYYLMGGGDPELRNSGATSLCMWEAIKHASQVSRSFDFEGSMIEPVERFFRSFGAIQTPYSMLTHEPSKRFRLLKLLREIVKR
jgi:hypothetical protein